MSRFIPSRGGWGRARWGHAPPPPATPTHGVTPSSPLQCDPNLQVYNVFIENLDERLPRIALFATRPIRAGEELTFDYNMHGTVPQPPPPPAASPPAPQHLALPHRCFPCCPHSHSATSSPAPRHHPLPHSASPLPHGTAPLPWGTTALAGRWGWQGCQYPTHPHCFPPPLPVDPVDAESTRMDSNFGLAVGGLGGSPRARGRIECKCGAAACRKYLF